MKRYLITIGARTSSGGTVTSASSSRSINGARVALEGDTVHCGHCHTDGVIKADGPRPTALAAGKLCALQDDLCICHCNPAPRLVANQQVVCEVVS